MSTRKWIRALLCICLFSLTAGLSGALEAAVHMREEPELTENLDTFRALHIDGSVLEDASEWSDNRYRRLTASYLFYNGRMEEDTPLCSPFSWYYMMLPESTEETYRDAFQTLLADARVFPVPEDPAGETVSYEDSWGGARDYGGKRHHEGTDLMSSINERGYFPVVSVSDGVVEKKGWLELGGYRLGIRAPHGAYYYYAHLYRYAEGIKEGSEVKAGDVIGYMGDSGYGEEGTVGKFAVHLHFGVYLTVDGEEVSVNPYEILRSLEKRRAKVLPESDSRVKMLSELKGHVFHACVKKNDAGTRETPHNFEMS